MRQTRPSSTALLIAACVVVAERRRTDPQPGPEALGLSSRWLEHGTNRAVLKLLLKSWVGALGLRAVEVLIAPGFVQHVARRKAWIEEECRRSINEGFTRVVVLGAGLDSLCARLAPRFPNVQFTEVDHPATQALKRSMPGAVRLVPADLREFDVLTLLNEAATPTLIILEGLLMYFTPSEVERLLRQLSGSAAPVRVIATAMEQWPDGSTGFRPSSWLIRVWLWWQKEPFRWSATRPEMHEILKRRGLQVRRLVDEDGLAERWAGPVLRGEVIVVADAVGAQAPADA